MTWQEGRPGDEQGGMRHALDLVAAQVPEPDLAETTWRQGRRVRRQRHVATAVGGAAALAMVAGTWSVLADRPSAGPAGTSGSDAVLSEAAPTPVLEDVSRADADRLSRERAAAEQAEAQRLWASLSVSCLEAQGIDAWTDDEGRGVSSRRPDERGLPGLQDSHDLCDQTMVLVMPGVGEFEATVPALPRSIGRGSVDHLYLAYSRTATCLSHNGLPTEEPPTAEEFAERFTELNGPGYRTGDPILTPWHPYGAALAQDGGVAKALEVCPVERYLLEAAPNG